MSKVNPNSGRGKEKNYLFTLDKQTFGAGVKGMMEIGKEFLAVAGAMAYFDNAEGSGRFTFQVARACVEVVKACIKSPEGGGISEVNKVLWNVTPRWQRDRAKYGTRGATQTWFFRGAVYNSIDVIYFGKHVQNVGIRTDFKVPHSSYPEPPGGSKARYKTIKVAEYARMLEFGTNKRSPMPLFAPAIAVFTRTYWPQHVKAVENAIKACIADGSYNIKKLAQEMESKAAYETTVAKKAGVELSIFSRLISYIIENGLEGGKDTAIEPIGRKLKIVKKMTLEAFIKMYGAEGGKLIFEAQESQTRNSPLMLKNMLPKSTREKK